MGGDGPAPRRARRRRSEAPPRGRGWTHVGVVGHRQRDGSPAWAGMDPSTRACRSTSCRLPRVGGDGPSMATRPISCTVAPPRGRGWTRGTAPDGEGPGGSPAWAGMDPVASSALPPNSWLPRVGGDGPVPEFTGWQLYPAPPRGRGWTRGATRRRARLAGSPAWAGMDPRPPPLRLPRARLPRVGGDGPRGSRRGSRGTGAPPRGRGWTLNSQTAINAVGGSPAWAGMDPSGRHQPVLREGLPRVGGDGPVSGPVMPVGSEAPPRGRGWTLYHSSFSRRSKGSPAWAGMDPWSRRACSRPAWLPRVGGDGPQKGSVTSPGMPAPPRGRGWTVDPGRLPRVGDGSPAWAGMDPAPRPLPHLASRLPRVGGDGPGMRGVVLRGHAAPPRGRGWTRGLADAVAAARGSPAWAGMDPPRSCSRCA